MRALLAAIVLLLAGRPGPGVLVTVRTLAIDGLPARGVDENALLVRNVTLAWDEAMIPPGWVAPRSGLAPKSIPLWQLGGADRTGQPFHGSGLEAVLAELEAGLREKGLADAHVELDRSALRRLSTPGSDGLLLVRVAR
jgi:hypothetical protein